MELAFKRQGFIIYKLIPCFIITLFAFMCLYGSSVYATTQIVDSNSNNTIITNENFDNEYPYSFLVAIIINNGFTNHQNQYKYRLFYSKSPFIITTTNDGIIGFKNSDNSRFYSFTTQTYDTNTTLNSQNFNTDFHDYETSTAAPNGINNILYSNSDIYDTSNNVVFQAPPQVQPTIVASQVEEVEMNKTLQEILGILPVVIVVLVGLIAIRKAIQFLMTRMKKA